MTAGMQHVDAAEVREGDLIWFLGKGHLVTRIEPYRGTLYPEPEDWRTAVEEPGGWRITLIPGPGGELEVIRP